MIRVALWVCSVFSSLMVGNEGLAQDILSSKPESSTIGSPFRTPDADPNLAPLSEDEVFFSAPEQRKSVQLAPKSQKAGPKRQEIRLLGVGRVGRSEADETHAILRVDGKQLYRRIGESIGQIEVVDIARRSITLQSDGERWTIELFEQPLLENSAVASSQPKPTRNNSHRQTRKPAANSADPKLVSVEPVMPTVQALPTVSLVDAPAIPDLDLPPIPELPDFSQIQ